MRAFISYSHKDAHTLDRLHTHLAVLRREGRITHWFDRDILAGGDIDAAVTSALESSDLFLALISPDFLASDYCHDREMAEALKRHDAGTMRVVPIIIEPCEWKHTPLGKLKAVPRDGKPISDWTNANTAFVDIVTELRRIAEAAEAPTIEPLPNANAAKAARSELRRYRVKKDFDEIDRSDFRDAAFETIRSYFERSAAEISEIEGLRGRFRAAPPAGFTCTVINQARQRGIAHLTVNSGRMSLGDITFNYDENGQSNHANGTFSIGADDYDLYLQGGISFMTDQRQKFTPEQVAEHLWTNLLERAGITNE